MSTIKRRMLLVVFDKHPLRLLPFIVVLFLLGIQPALSQPGVKKAPDSVQAVLNDTLLPNLVIKVSAYSATIDHTNFLLKRKFNITPITLDLPDIETKVKGFKQRLEKRGSQMNLRSLNSGVIILQEITADLASYDTILTNYSNELTHSNAEVKKIMKDPVLDAQVEDTILQEQLEDIRTEGLAVDSMQQKVITRVNLLRNKVSVNLLEAKDVISDMRYLTLSLKLGMWGKEQSPLFTARQAEYHSSFGDIVISALKRSWKIISIYLDDKWDVMTFGLLVLIAIFSWVLVNVRLVKKQPEAAALLEPMHFLHRGVLVGCLMAFFTYLPFFFANPPMSFLHACELLRLVLLVALLWPYIAKNSRWLFALLCMLWVFYAIDDILLEAALGERWSLFFAGLLLSAICIRIILNKKPNFIILPESPAGKALAIFSLTQALLSVIFNLTGRLTLAKILGVSAVQCLVLGISLKVFCSMVLEAIYLQSEAYQDSRFSDFINFSALRHRFLRILWIVACIVWFVSLLRNLALYDVMVQGLSSFFTTTRAIGNMDFTFKSVAVFICIIWLSTVISGFINFFFGNQKIDASGKRSKLGSMMLLIRLTIWALGFFIAVAAAGIPLDKLSIMIGALGVGIGFGLQNIVNNLVSGVIIAFERPIQVGDLIEVGGKTGVVTEIGVRSSKINNNEGADIIIPNGDLLSQHLINWTMQNRNKQVDITLDVPYNADIKEVKTMIQDKLSKNEKIMTAPAPSVTVQQLGERAVEIKVLFWVFDLSEAGSIRSNAIIEIYGGLADAGIQLPVYKGPIIDDTAQQPPR